MSDSERFRLVHCKCARVGQLIDEAGRTTDPVRAGNLYRTARSLSVDIARALKESLAAMGTARAALDDAA